MEAPDPAVARIRSVYQLAGSPGPDQFQRYGGQLLPRLGGSNGSDSAGKDIQLALRDLRDLTLDPELRLAAAIYKPDPPPRKEGGDYVSRPAPSFASISSPDRIIRSIPLRDRALSPTEDPARHGEKPGTAPQPPKSLDRLPKQVPRGSVSQNGFYPEPKDSRSASTGSAPPANVSRPLSSTRHFHSSERARPVHNTPPKHHQPSGLRRDSKPEERNIKTPLGSEYRFYLPSKAVGVGEGYDDGDYKFRHFDVLCQWDSGEETDTSELAPAVQYHRQYYTWHLQGHKDSKDVQLGESTWQEFLKYGSAAIENLQSWSGALRPRSIHDYKPLLVLLQGVLKVVLQRELDLYSGENLKLRQELSGAASLIDQMNKELARIKSKAQQQSWKTVVNTFSDDSSRRLAAMKRMADSQAKKDAERQQDLVEANQAKDRKLEVQEKELKEVREVARQQGEQLQDKEQMLAGARDKVRQLEKIIEDLGQKIGGHKFQMDALSQDMEFQLMSKDMDAKARRKSRLQIGMKKIAMQTQIEQLKGEQDTMKATINTSFFNWAAFRPVTEMQWAAQLVGGQGTASVPWESTIFLPKVSKLPSDMHILEVPGGSVVHLPANVTRELTVALPAFSTVSFPEGGRMGSKVCQQGVEYYVYPVSVPGGTSVIIPTVAVPPEVSLVLGPGTVVFAPQKKEGRPISPSQFGESAAEAKDGSENATPDSVQTIPRGGAANMKLPAGSTLVSPMGVRTTYHVPSACTYIFPMGQSRNMTVPPGTTARLKPGGSSVVMLPSRSALELPRHEDWAAGNDTADVHHEEEAPELHHRRRRNIESKASQMQPEQPDCCIRAPGGTEIVVPYRCPYRSGKFKVTVPPNTQVNAPPDELGVPEKRHTWRAGRLPQTGMVVVESRIVLPQPFERVGSRLLAERMKQIGPEACAAAIPWLDPKQVAEAVVESNFRAEMAAEMFILTRTQPAAQIVRRMDPLKLRDIIEFMPQDVTAAILSLLPSALRLELLEEMTKNDEDGVDIVRAIDDKANSVGKASQLLASDVPVRRIVDALLPLDSRVTSRLIANCKAAKAAYVLSRMAARLTGGSNAMLCADQLSAMSKMMKQISAQYNEADIKRARLLEDLARSTTEARLCREAVQVMYHMKEAYGIRCTLTRMSSGDDGIAVPKPKSGLKSKSIPSRQRARNRGKAYVRSKAEMKEMARQAEDAADKMEILFSMEEVQWSKVPVPGQTFTEEAMQSGLAVHMNPKVLQDAQEEAFELDEPLFRGVLLVVPVVLQDGTRWGSLSLINRNSASQMMLGGLGAPPTNSVPKACESLQLTALAIGAAMENIARVTKEHCEVLKAQKNEVGYTFDLSFEGEAHLKRINPDQAEVDLQSYTYWRRRTAKGASANWSLEAFDTIQNDPDTPLNLQLLLAALFISLDVGLSGFRDILGPGLTTVPKEDWGLARLWKYTRSLIEVNPHDPSNIPRLMARASKGLAETGAFLEADLRDVTLRTFAVHRIMAVVECRPLELHSNVASNILDWVYVQFKITDMQVKLTKDAKEAREQRDAKGKEAASQ